MNFADIMTRMGLYPKAPPLPAVPGFEAAGRIDAIGDGVPAERIGTPVVALTTSGAYTDVLCLPSSQVFGRPPEMPVDEAAALPVVYLTAYVALCVMGSLNEEETVLVHNAGGGVGLAAVDLCRLRGATTYGTASSWKHERLLERGVAACIDYRTDDFEVELARLTDGNGVHIVLDPLGGGSWKKSYRCLCATGRLVIYGLSSGVPGEKKSWRRTLPALASTPWLSLNPMRLLSDSRAVVGVNLQQINARPEDVARWMGQLLRWYAAGDIHPTVDRTFAFDEASAAHRYIQDRQNFGKVILVP